VIEQRLPVVARWVLYALGAVEGRRIRQPLDPVAAWLLKQQPGLLPTIPQPALLSTIRARTELVDRMLTDEIHRAQVRGERLVYWGLGGGFDARWFRMSPTFGDTVVEHVEVDAPEILALKHSLLAESPYASCWHDVRAHGVEEEGWTVTRKPGLRPLIVLELGAGRIEDELLRATLHRLRMDAGDARLIVGLPSVTGPADARWTRTVFARLGWRVEDEFHVSTRGRLLAPTGAEVCPGMYGFRVVRLVAREPVQV
jgi:hypothetical protein